MTWTNGGAGSKIPDKPKRIVRKRQNNRCAVYDPSVCTGSIDQFDHVVNLKSIGIARNDPHANDPALLQGLCEPCHLKKSSREGHAAKRAKRFRKPLQHPGLVQKENANG